MGLDFHISEVFKRIPSWQRFRLKYSNFSAAATHAHKALFNLPAGGVIHSVKIKHAEAFAGPLISAYTVAVGSGTTDDAYATAFDVFQAVGATTYAITNKTTSVLESHTAVTSIYATATSTGANTSVATAGIVDIWVLWSKAV